jgi:hypothetical protein
VGEAPFVAALCLAEHAGRATAASAAPAAGAAPRLLQSGLPALPCPALPCPALPCFVPPPCSLDALKWATKSLCNKDDELHLISVLESGLPNDVVGESGGADISNDCKPDPVALMRTQDLLKQCKGEAQVAGINNVKLTTLVSCVGGSADMVRSASCCWRDRGLGGMQCEGRR